MELPGLPQIPTDNLYKFQAYAGLVLFVFSMLFLGWLYWTSEQQSAEIAARDAVETAVLGRVREETERLDTITARRPIDTAALHRSTRELDSMRAVFFALSNQQKQELASIIELQPSSLFLGLAAITAAGIGIAISIVAMFHWYDRHQRYQDRLLVAEVERAELEVASERSKQSKQPQSHAAAPFE